MATFGLNNNLNNSYQNHSGTNSAQNQGLKAEKSITGAMNTIQGAMNSLNSLKSDSGSERAMGIAKMIMALLA